MSTQAAATQVEPVVLIPQKIAREGATSELAPNSRFRTRWGADLAVHEGNPDFVLSLARGLRVIEAFDGRSQGLSIADIARVTELSRAAVRRLLITLELLGYIESTGRKYR